MRRKNCRNIGRTRLAGLFIIKKRSFTTGYQSIRELLF
nr:MAG TPA: hypothetical protein [Caudoviricetes sp.]